MLDVVRSFTAGDFHLDCVVMKFSTQNETLGVLHGSGFITLEANGDITFRTIINLSTEQKKNLSLTFILGGESDDLVFDLEAVDHNDRTWTAKKLRINNLIHSTGVHWVLNGKIDLLQMIDTHVPTRSNPSLNATIPYEIPFPKNATTSIETKIGDYVNTAWARNVAIFETEEFSFQIFTNAGRTTIVAESKTEHLPEYLDLRVLESLVFITNQEIEFTVVTRQEIGRDIVSLLSTPRHVIPNYTFLPLDFRSPSTVDDAVRLYCSYFNFIKDYDLPIRHPLSRRIYGLVRATNSYLSQHQLDACVAAESLIDECTTINKEISADEMEEYEKLQKFISDELHENFQQRAKGVSERLIYRNPRVRLKEFCDKHNLDKQLAKSWDEVRNKRAHGTSDDIPEGSSFDEDAHETEARENFQRLQDITFLIYCMIFEKIGYKGTVTNNHSAKITWPIV